MDWPYYNQKHALSLANDELRSPGPLVPIQAQGLSLPEIEAAILQVLATGRMACVDEGCVVAALHSDLKRGAARKWADRFSRQYQFTWERRRLFGDLLFTLAPASRPEDQHGQ